MGYWIYILRSKLLEKYYVGQSIDPHHRLVYHNTIEKGFTSRYRPWELVYSKECETRREAKEVEMKVKGWKSKIMIRKLIEGQVKL